MADEPIIDFKSNVKTNFADLMAASIKDETPYKVAINFVETATKAGTLDSKEKVEVIANMMANIVTGTTAKAMDTAVILERESQTITFRLDDMLHSVELKKTQVELEKRMKPFRLDQMRIDTNIKEQKHFTEQLRNGGVSFTYTFFKSYFDNDNVKVETQLINETEIVVGVDTFILFRDYKRVATKTINSGTGLSTVELQNLEIAERTNFTANQSTQLTASVIYNNKIKALDSVSDLFGTLGAGGLIIPDTGWGVVLGIVDELANTTTSSAGFQTGIISI